MDGDGKRRKRRRTTPDAARSLSPEPGPSSRPSVQRDYYDLHSDVDESALPPPQASRADEAEFTQRLFEEMRSDEGADAWSSYYDEPPAAHVPHRYASSTPGIRQERVINSQGAVVTKIIYADTMDDEEYAEHIRAGMWRRTHAEDLRATEQIRLEAKKREEKMRAERDRARRDEAARVRKLEDTVRRKTQARDDDAREAYKVAWQRLLDPAKASEPLRAADFVWPVPGGGEGGLDAASIERFLVGHIDQSETRARRGALRLAVLAYHPDRFDRLLARVPERERASVREMGLRTSQLLNELLSTMTV